MVSSRANETKNHPETYVGRRGSSAATSQNETIELETQRFQSGGGGVTGLTPF